MKHISITVLTCIALSGAMTSSAVAQDRELRRSPFKLADLVVIVETKGPKDREFGTFTTFMGKLKQAGHSCRASRYEYGVNIACGSAGKPRVLIGATFAPSRAPELLEIHSIRANGINGGELAKAKHVEFINVLMKRTKKARSNPRPKPRPDNK